MILQSIAVVFAVGFSNPEGVSSLTTYIVPPERKVDYSSPRSLIQSLQSAQKSRKTNGQTTTYQDVGHVLVELHCESSDHTILAREFTAISDRFENEEVQKIYVDGVGFGFVFEGVEGEFFTAEKAYDKFISITKATQVYAIRINIPTRKCLDVALWMRELQAKSPITFALNLDSETDSQFGCANFAVRTMERAGVSAPKDWKREFLVPEPLIGGKLTGKILKPEDLAELPEIKRWAKPSEPHYHLRFYDPERLATWVKDRRAKKDFKDSEFTLWIKRHFNLLGVELSLSDLEADPVANLSVPRTTVSP